MEWADAFVAAFNRRDLAALAGLVAIDAVPLCAKTAAAVRSGVEAVLAKLAEDLATLGAAKA